MTEISFEVRGVPAPQGSTRAFVIKGKAVTTNRTPRLDAWRTAIAQEARREIAHVDAMLDDGTGDAFHEPQLGRLELLEGALSVDCFFFLSRPKSARNENWVSKRPDLDKLVRAVLDACTGVIWQDDSQVSIIHASKHYGVPGCRITVRTCQN